MPQHILPGTSTSCTTTPVGYTNRWQGFLDLVFPTDTRSSSSPNSAEPRNKYPSRRSILLHTNHMAEPAQPLKKNCPLRPVGKSDPAFDLQTDIIFGGNGGAKITKVRENLFQISVAYKEMKSD